MDALNGILQATHARTHGYRNLHTFITMIYMIAAPLRNIIKFS